MKQYKRIRKIGGSLMVSIDKEIINEQELTEGDLIEMDVVGKVDRVIRYKCRACEHHFETEDDNPYCPVCDCENLVEEKEIIY